MRLKVSWKFPASFSGHDGQIVEERPVRQEGRIEPDQLLAAERRRVDERRSDRGPLRDFQLLLVAGKLELGIVLRDRFQPCDGRFLQIARSRLRDAEFDAVAEHGLTVQLAESILRDVCCRLRSTSSARWSG